MPRLRRPSSTLPGISGEARTGLRHIRMDRRRSSLMPLAETIYYLEMSSADELRPSAKALDVQLWEDFDAKFSRSIYADIGGNYNWIERSNWTDDQWLERLRQPNVDTWLSYSDRELAGFFELGLQADNSVEIVYFGLLPPFEGRGLGGAMLSAATQRAWDMGGSRVWLHTSSLDHPHALSNYQARGFRVYNRVEIPGS